MKIIINNSFSEKKYNIILTGDINLKLIILLILCFYFLLIVYNKSIPNTIKQPDKKINNEEKFITDEKKLYNSTEYPLISIIINCNNSFIKEENIINLVSILLNQDFKDIQIIVFFNSSHSDAQNFLSNISNINGMIKIFISDDNNWKNKILDLNHRIKGKYLIFFEEVIELKNNEIFKIYNLTKGSIKNIFKYYTESNHYIYLIRSKILYDIIDSETYLYTFEEINKYIYDYPLSKFNYIPISFCPNNHYTSLVYTSMLSVLSSKSYYTYIQFYLIIPENFNYKNILFLESLYEQYEYFNITFIKMDDRYNNAFTIRYLTTHVYYRYSLGELIPNLDKIIYLDADTICLKDLSNLYNLNFRGKAILGRLIKYDIDSQTDYYSINTGILLMNLKKMRKIKIEEMVLNILKNGFGKKNITEKKFDNVGTNILTADQALLNIYFFKYIGIFPPKYNAINFNYNLLIQFSKDSKNLYEKEYLYYSYKFPIIKHFNGPKNTITHNEEWIYFAKKSKYFQKVTDNFLNIYNFSFL